MFKKITTVICVIICLAQVFSVAAESSTEKPQITAEAYVLFSPNKNEIVDSKNLDKKMYPASLTKMLTALVVMDMCSDLDAEKITVSENAVNSLYGTGSSNADIKPGEVFTVRQMLYLMLLPSGNDAANALAEHFDTEEKSFVTAMNDKAKAIGMKDSNFVNPHGLHDDNHYSTARDLAVLADAYMNVPLLYDIAKCNEYTVPQTNLQVERSIRSTNFLKKSDSNYYYEYATGLKTGNTDKAGRCLAASAEKDGVTYICILLNVPIYWDKSGMVRADFLEAKSVFEYAFGIYENIKVASKGQKLTQVSVYETDGLNVDIGLSNDVYATLPSGTNISDIKFDYKLDALRTDGLADSPVNKGDKFGKTDIILNNRIIGSCDLVALQDVEPDSLIVFWHAIDFYVYLVLGIICFFIILFTSLIMRKKIIVYKRKKSKQKRLERRRKMYEDFQKREPTDYFKMD